ncbi:hypothetical protein O9K51_05584 [Purpureocillium lavendulum]|uniref:Uncharacterized protein n=1 Tax=Purpureocillium lavendulum TaxID=1247861 RepID=A0AB34FR45_9HYPO|nr:hypothetical protein O9K51_05584 [Purpureocillium lavendulum]
MPELATESKPEENQESRTTFGEIRDQRSRFVIQATTTEKIAELRRQKKVSDASPDRQGFANFSLPTSTRNWANAVWLWNDASQRGAADLKDFGYPKTKTRRVGAANRWMSRM